MSDESKTGPKLHETSRAESGRRRFIQNSTATAVVAGVAPHLLFGKSARAASRTLKIGFIGPRTGALARFGEGNDFVLAGIRKVIANGIAINGATFPVEIIEKDSQSDLKHAAEIAADLIKSDHVDLMVASSTGATVNPVSDQCEKNGVPCITTDAPWQSWFFGRGGKPEKGFDWTYHFFWGLEDLIAVFTAMWGSIPTNKVVGALWPIIPRTSSPSKKPTSKFSPGCFRRRRSPRSGSKPENKASSQKSPVSPRESSSPLPSKHWAIVAPV